MTARCDALQRACGRITTYFVLRLHTWPALRRSWTRQYYQAGEDCGDAVNMEQKEQQ